MANHLLLHQTPCARTSFPAREDQACSAFRTPRRINKGNHLMAKGPTSPTHPPLEGWPERLACEEARVHRILITLARSRFAVNGANAGRTDSLSQWWAICRKETTSCQGRAASTAAKILHSKIKWSAAVFFSPAQPGTCHAEVLPAGNS